MVLFFGVVVSCGNNDTEASPKTITPLTDGYTVPVTKAYKERMVKYILGMYSINRYVTRAYAERLVDEAIEVVSIKENRWMAPHDLIGLAINESDLRWWIETGPKYSPDCGITQIHVAILEKRSIKARRALCTRLKTSTRLSFIYAMKFMNMNKPVCDKYYKRPKIRSGESLTLFNKRMTTWKYKQYRCLFNSYNQGLSFLWRSCERKVSKYKSDKNKYRTKLNFCLYRGRYWVRSLCFSRGVFLGRGAKMSCRKAVSVRWVNKVY